MRASHQRDEIQFHDRCAVCTAALAIHLGYPDNAVSHERTGAHPDGGYLRTRVFFIRNLGFVTPTDARRISLEDTLRFEKIHEETYREFGFELMSIEPAPLIERVSVIKAVIG
jgi:predicted ATPase